MKKLPSLIPNFTQMLHSNYNCICMPNLRCIAIDDNPEALSIIEKHIQRTDGLYLDSSFTESVQALSYLRNNAVDVVFLDQEMPDLSGIDFLEMIQDGKQSFPYIIFVSGHTECALKTYDYFNVISFLEKPVDYNRFIKSVKKLFQVIDRPPNIGQGDYIFFETRKNNVKEAHKVWYRDLISLESADIYTNIYTTKYSFVIRTSLLELENRLPSDQFVRIQKGYIININKIEKIAYGTKRVFLEDGSEVPFGKQYYERLLEQLSGKIYKEKTR